MTSARLMDEKVRSLRQTIVGQMDQISDMAELIALALPYVEAGQDEPEHSAAGKAQARKLAARIRSTVEAMKEGAR